jgi:hypothetical protein
MKTFSAALLNSYTKTVSTITTCIKMIRIDGTTYTFTNLDKDLVIDGETYISSYSFNPTSYTSALGLQIENMEIEGAVDSLNINDFDILKQKFFGAEVWLFSIDYKNISGGKDKILYGTVGEIEVTDKTFKMEIKGISKRYNNLYSSYYGKICRARFGDVKCGVDTTNFKTIGSVHSDSEGKTIGTKYIQLTIKTTNDTEAKLYEIRLNDRTYNNICTIDTTYRSVGATSIAVVSADDLKCGVEESKPLTNLIDGNNDTYVCIGKVATRTLNTIQINFDIIYYFYNLEIVDDSSNRITEITVKTSKDAMTWTSIITIPASSYRKADQTISVDFSYLLTPSTADNRYKFYSNDIIGFTDFPNYFQYGNLKWLSGLNEGIQVEVITSQLDGYIEVALPTPYNIHPGDTFEITAGCNHLLVGRDGTVRTGDCFTKFNNVINFRGEPYLPNEDVLLSGYIAQVVARESSGEEGPILLEPVGE